MNYNEKNIEELKDELQRLQRENTEIKTALDSAILENGIIKKELNEISIKWQATFNTIDDIILLLNPKHEIIDVNASGLTKLNKTRNEVLGQKCFHLIHNTDFSIPECPCNSALKDKTKSATEFIHGDRIFELIAWPFYDENDELVLFTHIVKDITERKKYEESIFQIKKDWEDVFDSITDSITIHDRNYNIERSNKAGKALLNLPENEIDKKLKCYSFYHGTDQPLFGCKSCMCLKNGKQEIFETFEPNLNCYIEVRAIPRVNSSNEVIGIIHIVRDITDRKVIENDLIKAKEKAEESDKLKSAFLANMSHEIRTPMNGILGFAELLKEQNLSGDEQNEYIRLIEKSSQRMLNIINDIVDISKIESGIMNVEITATSINEQIEEVFAFFKHEIESKGLSLFYKNDLSSIDSIINTDKDKVFAILVNLIKNAIKFTDQGFIDFGYVKKDDYLEFFVKDTGIGVSDEKKIDIFKRFIQADIEDSMARQGAGLGLSIAKAYVEMLGGQIWLKCHKGDGAEFYFTLPYNNEKLGAMVENDCVQNKQVDKKNKRLAIVLVAEDDEICFMYIESLLKHVPIRLLHAPNGAVALALYKENPDISLILMDVKMPVMSGLEAVRIIRGFDKLIPIVAQTAYAMAGDEAKMMEAGCNDYISKPIDGAKLMQLIDKYTQ